jgi:hypothetical protein
METGKMEKAEPGILPKTPKSGVGSGRAKSREKGLMKVNSPPNVPKSPR